MGVAKEADEEFGIVAAGIQNSQVYYQWWILDCGSYVGFDGWMLEVCS